MAQYCRNNSSVGTSHSATGAIKSALKYVCPNAHWIARRLATAGGKRIKMRPLSAVATIPTRPVLNQSPSVTTSRYYIYESTAQLRVQGSPAGKRPGYLPGKRRTCTSLAGRCQTPKRCTHVRHSTPATQHREARPATARCPPNPACCGLGNLLYTLRPFSGPPSAVPTNQRGPHRGPPHSIQNGPFPGHRLKQCGIVLSAP
jgi:hypothetical protein